jgi:hypothetical protein
MSISIEAVLKSQGLQKNFLTKKCPTEIDLIFYRPYNKIHFETQIKPFNTRMPDAMVSNVIFLFGYVSFEGKKKHVQV